MSKQETIDELWQRIREHPDFAGGTVFTREDVADVIYEPKEGWAGRRAPSELVDGLTDAQIAAAVEAIRSFLFEPLIYTWREALRENVPTSPEASTV